MLNLNWMNIVVMENIMYSRLVSSNNINYNIVLTSNTHIAKLIKSYESLKYMQKFTCAVIGRVRFK